MKNKFCSVKGGLVAICLVFPAFADDMGVKQDAIWVTKVFDLDGSKVCQIETSPLQFSKSSSFVGNDVKAVIKVAVNAPSETHVNFNTTLPASAYMPEQTFLEMGGRKWRLRGVNNLKPSIDDDREILSLLGNNDQHSMQLVYVPRGGETEKSYVFSQSGVEQAFIHAYKACNDGNSYSNEVKLKNVDSSFKTGKVATKDIVFDECLDFPVMERGVMKVKNRCTSEVQLTWSSETDAQCRNQTNKVGTPACGRLIPGGGEAIVYASNSNYLSACAWPDMLDPQSLECATGNFDLSKHWQDFWQLDSDVVSEYPVQSIPVSDCASIERAGAGYSYFENKCNFDVEVSWRDEKWCKSNERSGNFFSCTTTVPANDTKMVTKFYGKVRWGTCRAPDFPKSEELGKFSCIQNGPGFLSSENVRAARRKFERTLISSRPIENEISKKAVIEQKKKAKRQAAEFRNYESCSDQYSRCLKSDANFDGCDKELDRCRNAAGGGRSYTFGYVAPRKKYRPYTAGNAGTTALLNSLMNQRRRNLELELQNRKKDDGCVSYVENGVRYHCTAN